MKENLVTTTLAHEIKENVLGYLSTTYNIKNESFSKNLQSFLDSSNGLFKGPYIDIKLPFKTAKKDEDIGLDLKLSFSPYEHQVNAFKRLSSRDNKPESTLVVTGTGSGKSECFFIPIVDHCLREKKKGVSGVKAIVLYPMNALATDQASRITEFLFEHPQVTPKSGNLPLVSAGLLIGEDTNTDEKRESFKVLTKQHVKGDEYTYHVIDDRRTIVHNPPDIILTNYKMLDYLLMKPEFEGLWKSSNGESVLQYLVLDEMHTFDGAQGSDVALLIRRLKAKLGLASITSVGTSATLLSGVRGAEVLTTFAKRLFGERFDQTSIIPESRQSIEDVFSGVKKSSNAIPLDDSSLNYHNYNTLKDYVDAQIEKWFGKKVDDSIELGSLVQSHGLTKAILEILNNKPLLESELVSGLATKKINISLKQLGSFLSVLSHARKEVKLEGKTIDIPLYFVRVQLWVRELRRPISTLDTNNPTFLWFDDKVKTDKKIHLPPVFCEECGEQGFLTSIKENDFDWDISNIYSHFADGKDKSRYLFPWRESDTEPDFDECEELEFDSIMRNKIKICPSCGNFEYEGDTERQHDVCPVDHTEWQYFRFHHSIAEESKRDKRQCPSCETRNSLRLVASRITTLTSVINGQLFLSPLNPKDSKKLLVFADSVQDASHRAGYYNARTYRFNFRTAVQSFLKEYKGSLKLCELTKPFLDYWIEKVGEKKVVATFTPSDLQKFDDYKNYFEGKRSDILFYLEKRIEWEFFLEYSLRSQVGRTLEKTLCSAIYVDDDLGPKIESSFEDIANKYEVIRQAGEAKYREFVLGIIKRLLHKGGISLEILDKYREEENSWHLGKHNENQKWISGLPKGKLNKGSDLGALPKFLTNNLNSKVFEYIAPPKTGDNWYSLWIKKNLPYKESNFARFEYVNLYLDIFSRLTDIGIFHNTENPKGKFVNFGLNYENVAVTDKVKRLQCTKCAHKIVAPDIQSGLWINTPCIVARCRGEYGIESALTKEQNYYQRIYEAGDVERIFAHEHTGLLGRKTREEVEIDFKKNKGRREDSINLLSCTPTLEMGIDVGDLSATVVGSLPRAASNYQQQVGRAGRKSGAALIISVAQARPRDLLYFQYPEELISGNVQPPGCFLDAVDLLKRQVTAFLFDNFLDEIKGKNELKLKILREEILGSLKTEGIISNLKNLLSKDGEKILNRYKQYIDENDVHEDTWAEIKEYVADVKSEKSITKAIERSVQEYERAAAEIRPMLAEVNKRLKELEEKREKKLLTDEEKDELWEAKREKASLLAQEELIGGKDSFFEFLTRNGLLPNYAFQEDVIELTGIILDEQKEDGQKGIYVKEKERFVRPAKMALREFAPGNTFYGGGYKLQVEQLDVGGPRRTLIEKWRACRSCGHLERQVSKDNSALSCPKCNDPLWGDRGSEVKMLKMSKAVAIENVFSGHIGDESDDRDKKFFKVRPYFELENKSIRKTWKYSASDFVFGIEFLSKMTLREVNFGEEGVTNKTIPIAGEELPNGFLICPKCGRVATKRGGELKIHHTSTCQNRKHSTNDFRTEEDKGENLLLFRELQSEAIRLLLPVSDYEAETRVYSIKAAIMLGFREKFGGQPLHLEISEQRILEPSGNKLSKRYLVIFDSVPGGTGFLRELWDKDSFYELVQKAYDKLESCSCNENENLNGCPKCILSGIGQFEIPYVERDEAKKYLKKILENKDQMEEFSGSLDDVSINNFLDSDLEYRFVNILESCATGEYKKKMTDLGIEIKDFEFIDRNQYIAKFKVKYGENESEFRLSAHIPLNSGDNWTEADFIFEPIGDDRKSITLYLDGFEYHASKSSGSRFSSDFKKRQALFNGDESDSVYVWNLTWRDLDQFERQTGDTKVKYIGQEFSKATNLFGENHFVTLLKLLSGAQNENSEFKKFLPSSAEARKVLDSEFFTRIEELELSPNIIEDLIGKFTLAGEKAIGSYIIKNEKTSMFSYLIDMKTKEKTTILSMSSPLEGRDNEAFLVSWESFLHTWNIAQLFSNQIVCKVWAEEETKQ